MTGQCLAASWAVMAGSHEVWVRLTPCRLSDVSTAELQWRSGHQPLNTCSHPVQDREGGQVGIPVAFRPANHLPPNGKPLQGRAIVVC
jgi:hypothetical protein